MGDERSRSHTFHLHMEAEDEEERNKDVDDILCDGNHHRYPRVLHTDEPAVQGIET